MHRRGFLHLSASALFATAATAWSSGRPPRSPAETLPSGEPVLRMPFPAGTVVLCQQGSAQRPPRTHSGSHCWHALDFSNEAVDRLIVVAAAPGRVLHAIGDARIGDREASAGFGNHVKVRHGDDGWFTLYAHLDEVWAEPGEEVEAGTPLGTCGSTGAAGNRHLHFSLHRHDPPPVGVYDTVEMHALVTADQAGTGAFHRRNGLELRGEPTSLWAGHIYGAETSRERVLEGEPPSELARRLAAGEAALRREVESRATLGRFFDDFELLAPAAARARLASCAPGTASVLTNLWWAAAVNMPEDALEEAGARLRNVLAADRRARHWEADIEPWAQLFLGEVARRRAQFDAALTLLADAAESSPSARHYGLVQRQIRTLVGTANVAGVWKG